MTGVLIPLLLLAAAVVIVLAVASLVARAVDRRHDMRTTTCLCGHSLLAHRASTDGTCPYPNCNCDHWSAP